MPIFLLILQFILNFPSFVKAVIEIWKLIKEIIDPKEKEAYKARFKMVLMRCNNKKTVASGDSDEIHDLLAELKLRKQAPTP